MNKEELLHNSSKVYYVNTGWDGTRGSTTGLPTGKNVGGLDTPNKIYHDIDTAVKGSSTKIGDLWYNNHHYPRVAGTELMNWKNMFVKEIEIAQRTSDFVQIQNLQRELDYLQYAEWGSLKMQRHAGKSYDIVPVINYLVTETTNPIRTNLYKKGQVMGAPLASDAEGNLKNPDVPGFAVGGLYIKKASDINSSRVVEGGAWDAGDTHTETATGSVPAGTAPEDIAESITPIENLLTGGDSDNRFTDRGTGGTAYTTDDVRNLDPEGKGYSKLGADPEIRQALGYKKTYMEEGIPLGAREKFRNKLAKIMTRAGQISGLRMGGVLGGAEGASAAAQQRSFQEANLEARGNIERDILLKSEEAKYEGTKDYAKSIGEIKKFDIASKGAAEQRKIEEEMLKQNINAEQASRND